MEILPLSDKTTKSLVAAQLSGKATSSHRNTNYQNTKHRYVCVSVCASSVRSVSKSGFDYGSDLVQEHQFVKMYLGSKILSIPLQKVSFKLRRLIFGICNFGDKNHFKNGLKTNQKTVLIGFSGLRAAEVGMMGKTRLKVEQTADKVELLEHPDRVRMGGA